MGIGLFKRRYAIRRFQPQTIVGGYARSKYVDALILLDVQPLRTDEHLTTPEGQRVVRRLKSYSNSRIRAADEKTQTFADRIFYQGLWYECTSSMKWDHTILAHYRSNFVLCHKQDPPPSGKVFSGVAVVGYAIVGKAII